MPSHHPPIDVLAVDDDILSIEGLVSELDLRGVTVDCAQSIPEAVAKLKSTAYRLLLLDLRFEDEGRILEGEGLTLVASLIAGKMGETNKSIAYVMISAQDFSLETIEARLHREGVDLDALRARRLARLSKGDDITMQANRIETFLGSGEQ